MSQDECSSTKTRGMKRRPFGTLPDGRTVGLFVLENSNGCSASVTDFGATLTSLVVPDSRGRCRTWFLDSTISRAIWQAPLPRLDHRPIRKSDRKRPLLPRWARLSTCAEQRPNHLHGGWPASACSCGAQLDRRQRANHGSDSPAPVPMARRATPDVWTSR